MQSLNSTEVKSIEQFFQLTQKNLLKVMYKYLKTKYTTIHCSKDYIVAVGDIPVALTAHLDTVFPSPPKNIFYDRVKNVMWSPEGLGADDRAGVYAIVQILKKGLKPTIIFTTDEEKGAIGASELIKAFPKAPTDLKYIIELDRRGSVDCVFYECNNPKFERYIEDFGFVTAWGSFSDISVICPAWEIAGVNLSIGYENEHSYSEMLYIGHMQSTIKKVIKMLQNTNSNMEVFEYIPVEYNYYFEKMYGDNDFGWDPSYGVSKSLWKSWHMAQENLIPCANCNKEDYDYNLIPVKDYDNSTIFLCADCVSNNNNIVWCRECGEPFISLTNQKICYDCLKKVGNDA